jgi:ABC-type microcin C transport system permease subunit YejB
MSDNIVNTVGISLLVAIVVLLIEYLLIKPLGEAPADKKGKIVDVALPTKY